MIIKLNLWCGLVNGQGPEIEVLVNGNRISCFTVKQTELIVDVNIDNAQENNILFIHKNKTDQDTNVIDGQIVEDKFFKVTSIWIDDILLPESFCYGNAKMIYPEGYLKNIDYTPAATCKSDSLYFNGELNYQMPANFFSWLYNYHKEQDLEYIQNHHDRDAEEKYLGYMQESKVEQEIIDLLESHGYSITR